MAPNGGRSSLTAPPPGEGRRPKAFPVRDLAIRAGKVVHLTAWDPSATPGFRGDKDDGLAEIDRLKKRLEPLQELLHADPQRGLLVVLQGMDTAGKDGTIRRVFEGVNPQGVRVAQFGVPTPEEHAHDFLWRAHQKTPRRGEIVIFNRSHYEDVLVARVHELVPKPVWEKRYEEIDEFERGLTVEGTTILKFYLHIDADEQRRRLTERLNDPTKQWKLSLSDIEERKLWPKYMAAYEEMLERTSTAWAPWYLVPSNHRWYRDLVVIHVVVAVLESMGLKYPKLAKELRSAKIR
ncbi:MAG: polyphosphate kinase 2 family protein [Candidatus Lutacidiplasmatales archaeon]